MGVPFSFKKGRKGGQGYFRKSRKYRPTKSLMEYSEQIIFFPLQEIKVCESVVK